MTVNELRTLVDNLEEYIHVPGGIDRLKKMALHLAVSGQLVPQDPSEGTGEELYQQIQAEKTLLIKQGKIKKQKAVPEIDKNETPFMIPSSWKWVRLGDVTNYGSSEKAKPSSIGATTWILELEDIEKTSSRLLAEVNGDKRSPSSDKNIFHKDDVLYGKLRPYLDKVIVAHRNGVCSSEILPLRSPGYHVDPNYLRFALKSPYFLDYVNELTYGVKMPRLGTDDGRNALVGLAPRSEQKRIVEKVNNIFALIDRLAEAYKSEQAERSKLVASSLAQLAKGEDGVEGGLVLTHLSEIIRTKADAKILRQTILHLAASGQLVPQDPSEGTGEELYQQIQAEKSELIKQGRLKGQKPSPIINESETPFSVPESWTWVTLADVGQVVGGGTPSSTNVSYYATSTDNSIPWLTPADLRGYSEMYIAQGARSITEAGLLNSSARLLPKGSVLFSSRAPIGHLAIAANEITTNQGFKSVVPYSKMNPEYIYRWLQFYAPVIDANASGTTFREVSGAIVGRQPIPLPPLAEQYRIVAKTSQLLDLVAKLEGHLVG